MFKNKKFTTLCHDFAVLLPLSLLLNMLRLELQRGPCALQSNDSKQRTWNYQQTCNIHTRGGFTSCKTFGFTSVKTYFIAFSSKTHEQEISAVPSPVKYPGKPSSSSARSPGDTPRQLHLECSNRHRLCSPCKHEVLGFRELKAHGRI